MNSVRLFKLILSVITLVSGFVIKDSGFYTKPQIITEDPANTLITQNTPSTRFDNVDQTLQTKDQYCVKRPDSVWCRKYGLINYTTTPMTPDEIKNTTSSVNANNETSDIWIGLDDSEKNPTTEMTTTELYLKTKKSTYGTTKQIIKNSGSHTILPSMVTTKPTKITFSTHDVLTSTYAPNLEDMTKQNTDATLLPHVTTKPTKITLSTLNVPTSNDVTNPGDMTKLNTDTTLWSHIITKPTKITFSTHDVPTSTVITLTTQHKPFRRLNKVNQTLHTRDKYCVYRPNAIWCRKYGLIDYTTTPMTPNEIKNTTSSVNANNETSDIWMGNDFEKNPTTEINLTNDTNYGINNTNSKKPENSCVINTTSQTTRQTVTTTELYLKTKKSTYGTTKQIIKNSGSDTIFPSIVTTKEDMTKQDTNITFLPHVTTEPTKITLSTLNVPKSSNVTYPEDMTKQNTDATLKCHVTTESTKITLSTLNPPTSSDVTNVEDMTKQSKGSTLSSEVSTGPTEFTLPFNKSISNDQLDIDNTKKTDELTTLTPMMTTKFSKVTLSFTAFISNVGMHLDKITQSVKDTTLSSEVNTEPSLANFPVLSTTDSLPSLPEASKYHENDTIPSINTIVTYIPTTELSTIEISLNKSSHSPWIPKTTVAIGDQNLNDVEHNKESLWDDTLSFINCLCAYLNLKLSEWFYELPVLNTLVI